MKTTVQYSRSRALPIALIALTLISCNPDGATVSDESASALRRLLEGRSISVRVRRGAETSEWNGDELFLALKDECKSRIEQDPRCLAVTNSGCEVPICEQRRELCRAHLYLELAQNASEFELSVDSGPQATTESVVVLPPDPTNAARLVVAAQHEASEATRNGFLLLQRATSPTIPGSCYSYFSTESALVDVATTTVEAYDVALEASHDATERIAAVAHAARATDENIVSATNTMFTGRGVEDGLSLGLQARLALGGRYDTPTEAEPNLILTYSAPVCRTPPLANNVKGALDLIREAAPNPNWILNRTGVGAVTIDQLVVSRNGSVADRVAQLWGDDSLGNASAAEFYRRTGLAQADFVAAREYLAEEIVALGRSDTAQAPAREISNGTGTTTYTRYLATGTRPSPRPEAATLVAIRSSGNKLEADVPEQPLAGGPIRPSDIADYTTNAAGLVDFAGTAVTGLLQPGNFPADVRDKTQNVLALLATVIRGERTGRIEACFDRESANSRGRIRVFRTDPTEIIAVVKSIEGLKCATTGSVDGVDCRLGTYRVDTTPNTSTQTVANPSEIGFTSYVEFNLTNVQYGEEYYVVRRKPGAQNAAGGYEAISGARVRQSPSVPGSWDDCVVNPVTPNLERQAIQPLMLSSVECNQPATDCSGVQRSDRLPLEDELTDDGNAYENSWRNYLELAKRAADEADLLGEQMIERGESIDRQADAARQRVEAICGAGVPLDGLFAPDLNDFRGGPCSAPADCAANYYCDGGTCVLDPVQRALTQPNTPDANRLAQCLGSGQVLPRVAMGSDALCVWRASNDPNQVCATNVTIPASPGRPAETVSCPYAAAPLAAGVANTFAARCNRGNGFALPTGLVGELIDESATLNLFEAGAANGGGAATSAACNSIRTLRNRATPAAERTRALDTLRSSNLFLPEKLEELAKRLSWEAAPGEYGTVLVDQLPVLELGSPFSSAESLCTVLDTDIALGCAPTDGSVFCQIDRCNDLASRSRANHMLGRAVLAARVTTGTSLKGLLLPLVASFLDLTYLTDKERQQTGLGLPGTPGVFSWDINLRSRDGTRTGTTDNNGRGRSFCLDGGGSEQPVWLTDDGRPLTSQCKAALCDSSYPPFIPCVQYVERRYFGVVDPEGIGSSFVVLNAARAAVPFWNGLSSRSAAGDGRRRVAFWLERGALGVEAVGPGSCSAGASSDCIDGSTLTKLWSNERFSTGSTDSTSDLSAARDDGNFAALAANGLTDTDVLNGAELLCYTDSTFPQNLQSTGVLTTTPAQLRVQTVSDLRFSTRYLRTMATELRRRGGLAVLSNFPKQSFDYVRASRGTSSYPATGGEYAREIERLNAALLGMKDVSPRVAELLDSYGRSMERLRSALEAARLKDASAGLQLQSTIANQLASCATSAVSSEFTGFLKAAITCANSAVQINIASQLTANDRAQLGLQEDEAFRTFTDQFASDGAAMRELSTAVDKYITDYEQSLSSLESLRREARSQVSRALLTDSDAVGNQYELNRVLRRRYDVTRIRYRRALERAKTLAYLARRAIEQRLAMDMTFRERPSRLVAPPRTWINQLCTMQGIDYGRLRAAGGFDAENEANQYIGEYVRNLELLVESYRLDYPFQSQNDTAVLSMRNDYFRTRAECAQETGNLLTYSAQLEAAGQPGIAASGWKERDCTNSDNVSLNCIRADVLRAETVGGLATSPVASSDPNFGALRGRRVQFGTTEGTSTLTARSALTQTVAVPPGVYRLAWYGRAAGSPALAPGVAVSAIASDTGSPLTVRSSGSRLLANGWEKRWTLYEVGAASTGPTRSVTVQIGHTLPNPSAPMAVQEVWLTGLMLENVTTAASSPRFEPEPSLDIPTSESTSALVPGCEDTTGEFFRRNFVRSCEPTCVTGAGGTCVQSATDVRCYADIRFTLTAEDIERGRLIRNGGFNAGNYNYRTEGLSVNFVGTAIRDCSRDPFPSSCYSAGFIPYSVAHLGPYNVRSHDGNIYAAPLFTGVIEHGKGLSAERYVTNPLSSADRALLDPYRNGQFRGRPVPGQYVIRVWEAPGVNLDRIEDIQLVLDYRYWTRFE